MKLKHLVLFHYRNYAHLEIHFADGLNIITGENAQGKTNLLEAIFLLSLAKSHRTNRDQELIQWQQPYATVQGLVEKTNFTLPLEIRLKSTGKVAKVNHLEQAKLSHFVGQFNVILFAPEDLMLIKGTPAQRRRFLNIELGQSYPSYLVELQEYNQVLKQRNAYLKSMGFSDKFDAVYFEILTEQVVDQAVKIIQYRLKFIQRLDEIARPIHHLLSNQRDHLRVIYQTSHPQLNYQEVETLKTQLMRLFSQQIDKEKRQGTTLIGPHRDDVAFQINGQPAQFFGSQGQQRTIVLAIKLAEIELIKQIKGEYPVLLLDDVLSELDDERQHLLMNYIAGKVQTILTTATIKGLDLKELNFPQIFFVEQGKMTHSGTDKKEKLYD